MVYDIQNLTYTYPKQTQPANKAINLQIKEGEIFGMLGGNGAGKSTLVRQMVKLLSCSEGEIFFYKRPLSQINLPLYVGYMPQSSQALNNMTVAESLYFTAHLRGMSRQDAKLERQRLLELWQIEPFKNQPSTRLSGGQRRLLRLAVSMAGQPPVLILDEPTNDLDPLRRKLVWDVLRRLNREEGTTIIFITHDAIEAEKVIQRVGIMKDGELKVVGRPSDLKHQINQKLRLELFFSPEQTPHLPHWTHTELQAGHWLVMLEWDEVTAVFSHLDLHTIHDFRLSTVTLEDLYLHYANNT